MNDIKTLGKSFNFFFFAAASLDLVGVAFSVYWMELLFKPLIVLSLIALYLLSSERRNLWYFLALIFSLLGDIYLLDKNNMFMIGLGSFLFAQLLFIFILFKDLPRNSWIQRVVAALPFLLFLVLLLSTLKPFLGGFYLPVLAYGIAISCFGALSLLNFLARKSANALILLLGSVLFIASDSMIALNKFYSAHDIYPVAIMLTYVLAQYFIFVYMVSADREKAASERSM